MDEADYSYFQSIFDYYNISEEDITLLFLYNIHDDSKKEEIKAKFLTSVTRLIEKYSDSISNDNKKKNLLHRLIFERRLIISEIQVVRDRLKKSKLNF